MPRATDSEDRRRRASSTSDEAGEGALGRLCQLDDADSVFVAVERPEAPSHVAGLTIVDPTGVSGFDFERYRSFLRERVARIERLRWKLMEVPFGLDRAYWVEAEDFDVDEHLHRVALPTPGDRVALGELAGLIHEQPLDRSRPLWESWWIEGLEGGRVATLLKLHHSLMDGESVMMLASILMDLSPEPARPAAAPSRTDEAHRRAQEPPPRRPGLWDLAVGALANSIDRPQRMAVHARRAVAEAASRTWTSRSGPPPPPVPRTPFNGPLGRQRSFAYSSLPLGPIREARKHFGVTVNDVLLEIVSSSLRFGLLQTGDLPDQSIVALCPVSERATDDPSLGNQLSSMPVSLATHLPDPVARLFSIHASSKVAKERLAEGAFETLTALGESLVPGALSAMTRIAHAFPSLIPLPANLVVSNVRGPPVSAYLAGARVEQMYPLSMLQVANGINVTAVSHEDQVDLGFLVDRKLVPDPWIYVEGAERALEELDDAVAYRTRRAREREGDREPSSEAGGSTRERSPSSDDAARQVVDDGPARSESSPLDLQLLMASLEHVHAPARGDDDSGAG